MLNETKHTPGPWKAFNAYPLPHGVRWLAITSGTEATHAYVIDNERGEANARLIAKAPELLGALKALFDNYEMVHRHWGEGSNAKEADEAIKTARALIAELEANQ